MNQFLLGMMKLEGDIKIYLIKNGVHAESSVPPTLYR